MAVAKIVDYWAPWCQPCKIMDPILEELKKELGEKLEIEKVNADEEPQKASEQGVMGLPTFVIVKDGKEVGRKVGVTTKAELLKLING